MQLKRAANVGPVVRPDGGKNSQVKKVCDHSPAAPVVNKALRVEQMPRVAVG